LHLHFVLFCWDGVLHSYKINLCLFVGMFINTEHLHIPDNKGPFHLASLKIKLCTIISSNNHMVFVLHGATAPSGPGPPHYEGFTITLRHNTVGWTSLDEWSARRRDLYLTTSNTHKTSIHVPGRIRTRHPSKRAATGNVERRKTSSTF
jgi:hypothetical protein